MASRLMLAASLAAVCFVVFVPAAAVPQQTTNCRDYFPSDSPGYTQCLVCNQKYFERTSACAPQCQRKDGLYDRACVEACMAPHVQDLADCVARGRK